MRNPVACCLLATLAFAQAPQFEVASVRPNLLDDRIVTIDVGPGNRFSARGYTLVLLIQRAYGVMDWNVTGGPSWIRDDRFDVSAKAAGALTEASLQPMLQRLLADRFKLRVHNSTREMPGYALVVARGGLKAKAAAGGEELRDTFRFNQTGLSGQSIAMPTFARFVGGKLGWVAVDETGLSGLYDVKAVWKVEQEMPLEPVPGYDPRDPLRFAANKAIEEQLGLKIIPKRITVQTIVIDSVEKATASDN